MKLTDTYLVILSAASQRPDYAVVLPETLKGGAAQKVVAKLTGEGLLEEIRAKGKLPVWRRDAENVAYALRITTAGLKAINAEEKEEATEATAPRRARTKPGPAVALKAGGKPEAKAAGKDSPRSRPPMSQPAVAQPAAGKGTRAGSKMAEVTALLQRRDGATTDEIIAATGWLPHTTRAAISGVRKRGTQVDLVRGDDGKSRYRAVASAS